MIGGNPEGEEQKHHGYEVDILERSCRASIERLQCEYIDLYQVSSASSNPNPTPTPTLTPTPQP